MGLGLACCKVGLDRPLIRTAFVANLFRSARVPHPAVWPTVGLEVTRRRPGTGRPALAEDGRVRRTLPEPAFEVLGSSRAAAADRSLEALAPGHRDGHDHSPSLEPRSGGGS